MLEVCDVTAGYGGAPVLRDVSLTVDDGEIVALLGPSGSGKSTLLRVIAGLVAPDAGRVLLGAQDVTRLPTHRRGIGMVFQDEQLFPHRDVAGNVGFGLRMQGRARADIDRRVAELLALVGLAGFERRTVDGLSGGEAKRVALARSLAPAPRLLLLDEPLTGLDRELHDRLAVEVGTILRTAGTTALLVTHDRAEADAIADRVVLLDGLGNHVGMEVVTLVTTETHELRRRVLRNDDPAANVVFDGDDDPTTVHLGVRDDTGRPVAVSTWRPKPGPVDPSPTDRQLRGMAVDDGRRGTGIGTILLAAGVDRAFADGAAAVWANARDTALAFYLRHGFEVIGDGFVQAETGLPHHRVRRARPTSAPASRSGPTSAAGSEALPPTDETDRRRAVRKTSAGRREGHVRTNDAERGDRRRAARAVPSCSARHAARPPDESRGGARVPARRRDRDHRDLGARPRCGGRRIRARHVRRPRHPRGRGGADDRAHAAIARPVPVRSARALPSPTAGVSSPPSSPAS